MMILSLILGGALLPLALYLAFSGDWGAPDWLQFVAIGLSLGMMLQRQIGYVPAIVLTVALNALIIYLVLLIVIRIFQRDRSR